MEKSKIVFIIIASVILLVLSYFLSGFLILALNKVKMPLIFEYYHLNFAYEAIINGYPKTWQSIGISLFFCFGIATLLLLFSKSKQSLYGDARFANMGEIRKAGLLGDKNNYVKHGIIIGKYGSKFLQFGGQQFVALGAPTRSGKGVGIVIPNLLHWEESAVVQDIKQECFDYTSKYRKEKLNNEVFLFNPFSNRTHRYNPFTYIDMNDDENADSQLMDLANIVYPIGSDGTDKFFSQQAQNLFIGLCYLYKDLALTQKGQVFLDSYGLALEFNFWGILQLSKGFDLQVDDDKSVSGFEPIYKLLKDLGLLSDATIRRIGSYMQIDSANTKSGVMATFNAPLTPFEGETLRLST